MTLSLNYYVEAKILSTSCFQCQLATVLWTMRKNSEFWAISEISDCGNLKGKVKTKVFWPWVDVQV